MEDELSHSGQEIVKAMMSLEVVPYFPVEQLDKQRAVKLPLAELALAGGALASMSETFRTVTQTISIPNDGLFRFDSRGLAGHVAQMKDGSGQLTAIIQDGKGIIGNGVYVPANPTTTTSAALMAVDPMMLAIGVALADVSAKLDNIKEMQEEILGILEEEKKASLKGNIKFLADTLSNFKYNVDNEKWRSTRQQEVVSIEREAEKDIEYYRAQVAKLDKNKGFFHGDRDIVKVSAKADSLLGQYQAALYMLGFATYVDVMLTENFSADYLRNIEDKLESYSLDYRALYTDAYNKIEELASSSVENALLGGVSAFGKLAGGAIAKIPVISDGPVDEALIDASNLIGNANDDRRKKASERILARRDSCVDSFRHEITKANALFNKPQVFYFDDENVYCAPALSTTLHSPIER